MSAFSYTPRSKAVASEPRIQRFVRLNRYVKVHCRICTPAVAIPALLITFSALADGPTASSDLKSLYAGRHWIELRKALQTHKGPTLYRGAVAAAFNEDRRAEGLLRSVVASAPHSEDAYEAYEWLAHIYLRTGRYRQFVAAMEARWAASPNRIEAKDEQAEVAGFRGLPDQITGSPRPSKLPHEPGEIFIPMSINSKPATYFFDTGAWVSCLSESEAKRLGLTIRDSAGTLGTSAGASTKFRTAVAPEVVVGNIHFRDVSFAVFRDDQEPWSNLLPGRRGLIGISVILGFRTLRWNQDGIEIGVKPMHAGARESNLLFSDDHLVIAAESGQHRIFATLDTGAMTTDLYELFAKEFADLLSEAGKKDTTEARGVGHAETFESVTLAELKIKIGNVDTALRPAHVLLKQIGSKCCAGNFGMDLLKQARAFRIDFGAMTLDLENP